MKTKKNYLAALFMIILISFSCNISSLADVVKNISWGDINQDELVNAVDALLVLKHSAKLEIIGEDLYVIADVDANERIDASDALEILKYAAGIINSFPVEDDITPETTVMPTELPTATPYVEPTPLPEFHGSNVEVMNLNDIAYIQEEAIVFNEPNKKDGVEMVNPFIGVESESGYTLSFWIRPSESYFATDYGYTSVLVFVNEATNEILKFDAEGTYQYSDGFYKFRYKSAEFAMSKGEDYFITCVITSEGVKYYIDGKQITGVGFSGTDEQVAYSGLLNLLTAEDTQLYIGGNDSIHSMMASSAHKLGAGSVVKAVTSYNYSMTKEEVYSLYCVESYKEDNIFEAGFSGNLWIIGDSIAAYHSKEASVRPLYGWGELIGDYFVDDVRIYNMGISSQSTSSYYSIRRPIYDYIFESLKKDDYVVISFGHNDHNNALLEEFNRMTSPYDNSDTKYSFKWWLKNYYIDPIIEKDAVPILMSAVVRCSYNYLGFYEDEKHLLYGKAMKELVEEYAEKGIEIYYIDAQSHTYNLYSSLGQYDAVEYHGQYGSEANHFFDNTHYSYEGARMISEYIIAELKKSGLAVVEYIK